LDDQCIWKVKGATKVRNKPTYGYVTTNIHRDPLAGSKDVQIQADDFFFDSTERQRPALG